jgi:hypothetical protein
MSSALHLLPRRRALAIRAVQVACGLSLITLSGYAQGIRAVGARASASQTSAAGSGTNDGEGIRAFHVDVSEAQLDDLRKRIAATR